MDMFKFMEIKDDSYNDDDSIIPSHPLQSYEKDNILKVV
jgi:hypothetical protein